MKRKLVKQGAATMMISLPTKWIKTNNLDKGDEIDLEETNNNLIISSKKGISKENKIKFDISGFNILSNRVILNLYIRGVDEIELTFTEFEDIKKIQKQIIPELLGFEIIKQTQNTAIIKDVTGLDNQEIDDLIKRIFFILDSMAEELTSAIKNKESFDPIIETDKGVNRFSSFCLRILNKRGYKEFSKTSQIYEIVTRLEEIGDIYKDIARECQKKMKPEKGEIAILEDLRRLINDFNDLLFKYDKSNLLNLAKEYESIRRRINMKDLMASYLYNLNETVIRLMGPIMVQSL